VSAPRERWLLTDKPRKRRESMSHGFFFVSMPAKNFCRVVRESRNGSQYWYGFRDRIVN